MTEERMYQELTAMTGATPIAERMLDEDTGLRRCLDALTGQKPATLDDFVACYGDEEPTDAEQRLYEEFSEMMDVPIRPTPEPSDTGYVLVPADLVKQINGAYQEVSRLGYLTERDLEEKLHAWLAESSGA